MILEYSQDDMKEYRRLETLDLVSEILERNKSFQLNDKIFNYINDNFETLRKYHNVKTLEELTEIYKKVIVSSFIDSVDRKTSIGKKINNLYRKYGHIKRNNRGEDKLCKKIFNVYEEYLNDVYVMLKTG